jgi:hypothetical protein
MQILTPTGYKDLSDLAAGDEVITLDEDGNPITNTVVSAQYVDEATYLAWADDLPPFYFRTINGTWTLNSEQSIWAGSNVTHVKHLAVGDTLYTESGPITVTSLDDVSDAGWYLLEVDGDHSYILDGLIVHNASRFWVGGAGTWDSSSTAHWAATSGGGSGASAPGSADTCTFDASSTAGTATMTAGTYTFQTITSSASVAGIDMSAGCTVTLSSSSAWQNSGSGVRSITLGASTINLSSVSAPWAWGTTTNLTPSLASSTINFTNTSAGTRTFNGGGLTYGTVTFAAVLGGQYAILQVNTFGTLTLNAPCVVSFAGNQSVGALTVSGSSSTAQALILSNALGTSRTITGTSAGTNTIDWTALSDMTFAGAGVTWVANDCVSYGDVSGITVNAPSYGAGGSTTYVAGVIGG